ncbi:cadherin repeat domain-containing protein [Candidatus Woesearchaeota archaeon]|nr:cadherin repeat domain-containing protein [Candidatus Woesearchaeota archaeon]
MLSRKVIAVILILFSGCIVQQPQNNTTSIEPEAVIENNVTETISAPDIEISQPSIPTKTFREGDLVSFPNLKAVDPDGDPLTYKFSAPLDSSGKWQTKKGDSGTYATKIIVSDGQNSVEQEIMLNIKPANYVPVIYLASDRISIKEGETIDIPVSASDEDGDNVSLTYSGWLTEKTKDVGYKEAGTYKVFVTASDGKDSVTEEIIIEVINVNNPPVLDKIPSMAVVETQSVVILPSAQDPDEDELTYTFSAPLDSDGRWQTKKGDAGEYTANITVSDGEFNDMGNVKIIVNELNLPPEINVSDAFRFIEGETVVIQYTAMDPEGEDVSVSFSGWMTANTKQLNYNDAGTHTVIVTANDGKLTTSKTITVIVEDVNRAPVFAEGSFE